MKKTVRLVLLLALPIVILSCNKDDDPDPHEVGAWQLQSAANVNLPATHTWYSFETSLEGLGVTSDILTLNGGGDYTRITERTGFSTLSEEGSWNLNEAGDLLTLEATNSDVIQEYSVIQNSLDLLKITFPVQQSQISNEDRDNLLSTYDTQEALDAYLDSLTNEQLNALFPVISYDRQLNFSRRIEQQ